MNPFDIRREALDQAIRTHLAEGGPANSKGILATARAFDDFLNNRKTETTTGEATS